MPLQVKPGGKGGTFGVAKRLTGERGKKAAKAKDSQGPALKQKTFALGESADQLLGAQRGAPWEPAPPGGRGGHPDMDLLAQQ